MEKTQLKFYKLLSEHERGHVTTEQEGPPLLLPCSLVKKIPRVRTLKAGEKANTLSSDYKGHNKNLTTCVPEHVTSFNEVMSLDFEMPHSYFPKII